MREVSRNSSRGLHTSVVPCDRLTGTFVQVVYYNNNIPMSELCNFKLIPELFHTLSLRTLV